MSTILKYVPKCKVATLVVPNNKEFWSDIRSDADRVATDIRSNGSVTPYQTEYLQVLVRFFELFGQLEGDIPLSPPKAGGDPNILAYPLPNSVAADPESIRRWAETWEVFDLVLPEDGAWGWHGFENLVFSDIKECADFPQLLRLSENGDEDLLEFDTEVEGEAAWDVIEVDLFKDDVTTEEQNLIWEEREKRSDLDDPEKMKKRRENLEEYFIIKYEWESSALDAYRGWADTLEAGWQNFQKLCDS
ncbi:hypothetical protein KP79_PYT10735 [Mizuhopecten yessoensis]|uniref:Uncharacterized protein n=2 Tax=Mizuhopecten yessoensis TaxID=6573 RepID=A0A210PPF5_MIZYE|nr:hypothetical protein KP79_PYT10735 [Mizuhopecten yessoensis]